MNNLKFFKCFSALAVILLVAICVPCFSFATDVAQADYVSEVGKTITVSIELPDEMVTGNYTIEYATEYLEYVEGSANPANDVNVAKNGVVTCVFHNADRAKTITAQFKVIKGGNTSIKFVPGQFANMDREKVTVTGVTRTVSASAPETSTEPTPSTEPSAVPSAEPSKAPAQSPSTGSTNPASYHQTGSNIAIVGAIALVVIAGSVLIIKKF